MNRSEMSRTRNLTITALMTAVLCILGPIVLPIGPIPISLTNLAIYLALYAVGTRRALVAYLVYLLLGIAGLPVFSAFEGGPQKLVGPTGGYLIGFILMLLVAGWFIDRDYQRKLPCNDPGTGHRLRTRNTVAILCGGHAPEGSHHGRRGAFCAGGSGQDRLRRLPWDSAPGSADPGRAVPGQKALSTDY